jgi:hypothetical protein
VESLDLQTGYKALRERLRIKAVVPVTTAPHTTSGPLTHFMGRASRDLDKGSVGGGLIWVV